MRFQVRFPRKPSSKDKLDTILHCRGLLNTLMKIPQERITRGQINHDRAFSLDSTDESYFSTQCQLHRIRPQSIMIRLSRFRQKRRLYQKGQQSFSYHQLHVAVSAYEGEPPYAQFAYEFRNINLIPFQLQDRSPQFQDRLTLMQQLLISKPAPLRSSNFDFSKHNDDPCCHVKTIVHERAKSGSSFNCLLLHPRSVL